MPIFSVKRRMALCSQLQATVVVQQWQHSSIALMLCLNTLVPFLKYHFTFIHAAMWTAFSHLLIHITTVAVSIVKAVVCCFCYLKFCVLNSPEEPHVPFPTSALLSLGYFENVSCITVALVLIIKLMVTGDHPCIRCSKQQRRHPLFLIVVRVSSSLSVSVIWICCVRQPLLEKHLELSKKKKLNQ